MRIESHGLGVDRNRGGIAGEIGQVAAVQAYGHERDGLWRIRRATLRHDPEKCEAVFRKDHAKTKPSSADDASIHAVLSAAKSGAGRRGSLQCWSRADDAQR